MQNKKGRVFPAFFILQHVLPMTSESPNIVSARQIKTISGRHVMADFNPYQTPNAYVEDVSDGVDGELAGRGSRLGAVIVDALIFIIPGALAGFGFAALRHASGIGVALVVGLIGVVSLVIINLVMLHRSGQTIGKRVVGVKIVRTNGDRAGLARIFFLRSLVPGLFGTIPIAGHVFTIVDDLFIFRESRRCLHDLLADTIVIQA
jgi:uncharacterized RDD family membrane protein YckC